MRFFSCTKEELPQPLVGSWVHYSESFQMGVLQNRLIFEDSMKGESIYEISTLCFDSVPSINGTWGMFCYGGGKTIEKATFRLQTVEDFIEMKFDPLPEFEAIIVEQYTNTISGSILLSMEDLMNDDSLFY